jgi:hypothetical protein
MPLTLRPTGMSSPALKGPVEFLVYDAASRARPAAIMTLTMRRHRAQLRLLQGQRQLWRVLRGTVHLPNIQNRSGPKDQRWFWALHAPGGRETLRSPNQVSAIAAAKAEFEASWKQWRAWATLDGAP